MRSHLPSAFKTSTSAKSRFGLPWYSSLSATHSPMMSGPSLGRSFAAGGADEDCEQESGVHASVLRPGAFEDVQRVRGAGPGLERCRALRLFRTNQERQRVAL